MTLQEQIEKARIALNQAKDLQAVRESDTKDTRYGKFDPKSTAGKKALADLAAASKKVKEAQAYYDNLQSAFTKEQEKKAITGEEEGVPEEVAAAKAGQTVEEYRASKQAALDENQAKVDAANQGAADQAQQATYSQFINTLVADETQLKAVQADLKRNFPKYYTGGTNGLKDWVKTQAALEAIYTQRDALPKALQAADLRTFLINPPVEGFGTGSGSGDGGVYATISNETQASSLIKNVIKSSLGREATPEEISTLTKALNKAEKANPFKVVNGVTTGGIDKTEFLIQQVEKLPEFATKKAEKDSLTSQSISATARANGVNLSQDQLNNYLTQVKNGTDIKVINNAIRQSAGLGMPDSVKKLLAEGTDLDTIYSPYKTTMAALLEIPSDKIDLNDATLRSAIGPDKEMPLYDFRKALKKDARWQYTNNARKEVSDNVLRVLQDFGFQG